MRWSPCARSHRRSTERPQSPGCHSRAAPALVSGGPSAYVPSGPSASAYVPSGPSARRPGPAGRRRRLVVLRQGRLVAGSPRAGPSRDPSPWKSCHGRRVRAGPGYAAPAEVVGPGRAAVRRVRAARGRYRGWGFTELVPPAPEPCVCTGNGRSDVRLVQHDALSAVRKGVSPPGSQVPELYAPGAGAPRPPTGRGRCRPPAHLRRAAVTPAALRPPASQHLPRTHGDPDPPATPESHHRIDTYAVDDKRCHIPAALAGTVG